MVEQFSYFPTAQVIKALFPQEFASNFWGAKKNS
jgi:hypothetical protein